MDPLTQMVFVSALNLGGTLRATDLNGCVGPEVERHRKLGIESAIYMI